MQVNMSSKKELGTINLLNPMNPPQDAFSLIYNWLNSAGKFILIIVEGVVLVAFFTRFILDKQNNDLTEAINNKVTVLSEASLRKEELYFNNINALLQDISNLTKSQELASVNIAAILDSIPADIRLTDFQYYQNTVSMSFIASSFDSISNYESDLDDNPNYQNVSVNLNKESSSADVNAIKFSVSFELKDNNGL